MCYAYRLVRERRVRVPSDTIVHSVTLMKRGTNVSSFSGIAQALERAVRICQDKTQHRAYVAVQNISTICLYSIVAFLGFARFERKVLRLGVRYYPG